MHPLAILLVFFLFLSPLVSQTQAQQKFHKNAPSKPTVVFKKEGESDLYILNHTLNIEDYKVGEQIMITTVPSNNRIQEESASLSKVTLKKATSENTLSLGNQAFEKQTNNKTRDFEAAAQTKQKRKLRKPKSKKKKGRFNWLKKRKKLKRRKSKKRNFKNTCYQF